MIEREVLNGGMLVVTKCSGKVTVEELISSAHWMIDNYGGVIKPDFCQIFHALDADTDAITEDDIHRVAHINLNQGKERSSFSMAIIAVKPYPLALARLHKLLSSAAHIRVQIFSDADTACKWLGIPDPAAG